MSLAEAGLAEWVLPSTPRIGAELDRAHLAGTASIAAAAELAIDEALGRVEPVVEDTPDR